MINWFFFFLDEVCFLILQKERKRRFTHCSIKHCQLKQGQWFLNYRSAGQCLLVSLLLDRLFAWCWRLPQIRQCDWGINISNNESGGVTRVLWDLLLDPLHWWIQSRYKGCKPTPAFLWPNQTQCEQSRGIPKGLERGVWLPRCLHHCWSAFSKAT